MVRLSNLILVQRHDFTIITGGISTILLFFHIFCMYVYIIINLGVKKTTFINRENK